MTQSEYVSQRNKKISEKIIKNLEKRFFSAYFVETKQDALKKAIELISKDDVVSWGGSMSVVEIGLIDYILKNNYKVINRDLAKSKEEKMSLLRQALLCDTYLMGTNAITKDGELVNIDCMGNRTASLMFGPKNVIVIIGMNKICTNLEEAISRARNQAAPINMQRISAMSGKQTPCSETGECHDCKSLNSICSHIVVTRLSNPQNRIKIILVNENLGF